MEKISLKDIDWYVSSKMESSGVKQSPELVTLGLNPVIAQRLQD